MTFRDLYTRRAGLLLATFAAHMVASIVVAQDTPSANDPVAMLRAAHEQTTAAATVDDYTEIIDQCQRALSLGLDQQWTQYAEQLLAWTYDHRGEQYAEEGREEDALEDFSASVALAPTRWQALHNRGVSLALFGRYDEALADFDRAVEINPSYGNAYFNRGEIRYEQGMYQEAIDDYDRALRLVPDDSAIYNSRGHARYRLDDYVGAVEDYSMAIRLDPQNAAAYTNRGDAYADKGRFEQAAEDYRRAIRIDPELGRAYQSAAWLMATCPDENYRNPQLALQAARKAIEIDGREGNFRYLDTLAAALAAAGQYADAVATLEEALSAAPQDLQDAYRERLALYEAGEPYRDGWPVEDASNRTPRSAGF